MSTSVAVNLLWLRPGFVGGSEELVCGYLRSLPDRSDVEVTMFSVEGFAAAHPELVDRYATVEAPTIGRGRAARVALERTWLRRRTIGFDVVHHAGGTVPTAATPTIVTIHDLQPLDRPEAFSAVKRQWMARQLPRAVAVADAIHVTTDFVGDGIADRFPAHASKIAVIPPVVELDTSPAPSSGPDVPTDDERLARLAVVPPFVLYPAITYPHKNHGVLIEAVERCRRDRPELQLVLCGAAGPDEDAVVRRLGPMDRRLGRVSRPDLESLLRSAAMVAFPSRYEGFGLPVVEAMRAGTPVVAADATALTAVVGDHGLLVDPDDPVGWAEAIRRVLDDSRLAERLVAAGHERAAMFDPEPVGRRLTDLYRSVGQRRGGVPA